jgi:hypothetical protein
MQLQKAFAILPLFLVPTLAHVPVSQGQVLHRQSDTCPASQNVCVGISGSNCFDPSSGDTCCDDGGELKSLSVALPGKQSVILPCSHQISVLRYLQFRVLLRHGSKRRLLLSFGTFLISQCSPETLKKLIITEPQCALHP